MKSYEKYNNEEFGFTVSDWEMILKAEQFEGQKKLHELFDVLYDNYPKGVYGNELYRKLNSNKGNYNIVLLGAIKQIEKILDKDIELELERNEEGGLRCWNFFFTTKDSENTKTHFIWYLRKEIYQALKNISDSE